MASKRGARPDYEDVAEQLERRRNDPRAAHAIIGRSPEGRPIPAVTVSGPGAPPEEKQRALVIAGQHGNEESGRAIALALVDFLLADSPEAHELLRGQEIAVVPCANPDGAQADTYHNANDVNTAHDFEFEGEPETPEARALERFACDFCPELFVDVHGLSGGSMSDRVWLESQHGFSMNRYFTAHMATRAMEASEALGYPTCEPAIPPPLVPGRSRSHRLGEKLAYLANTLGFGVEAIEHYYEPEEWIEAGLARIQALLAYGSRDAFGIGEKGYPNSLISGHRVCGLKAHGARAAERRANRAALTAFLSRNMAWVARGSDGLDQQAVVKVFSETSKGPRPERFAVMLRFKKPFALERVTWDGRALPEGRGQGFVLSESASSVQLLVEIEDTFGGPERRLEVAYRRAP